MDDGKCDWFIQVMTNLHGKPKPKSLPDIANSPTFQSHAQQAQTPEDAAPRAHTDQACAEVDMSDVAVHKFPVEKQLLLQMRFRQMHGRKPADLITTPAKRLPVRSSDAGVVSPSHVGPTQPSSVYIHHHPSQSDMQLPTATINDSPPAAVVAPSWQHDSADAAAKVPSDIPPFEDLRHCENIAAMQEAEAGMTMVQHVMTDPGIHAQWPIVQEAHMPPQQRTSIPQKHAHQQQQVAPSFAWSTQQLTAIAASAATAAAAAFQQEINAKQAALALAADSPKSAEQMQIHIGALKEPEVRQSILQAAAADATHDAQTMTESATLWSSQDSKHGGSGSQAPVPPASVQQDRHPLKQSQQPRKQQAVPKQSAALHKLKHRSSASRGLTGHASLVSRAKNQAACAELPAESAEQTQADRQVVQDHEHLAPQMQQVRLCDRGFEHVTSNHHRIYECI